MLSSKWFLCAFALISCAAFARQDSEELYFVKAFAKNKYERSKIAEAGIAIDAVFSDSVTFFGTEEDVRKLKGLGISIETSALPDRDWGFPSGDENYHDYPETLSELNSIVSEFPNVATRINLGKSLEGRDLAGIRLSANPNKDSLPTAVFLGCHHAREHLSVEVPLKLARHLADRYQRDPRITQLLNTREVWIVPMINPDGAEYDIASGSYRYWRKNRRANGDGTFGVDLNRNYGGFFGGPGSSGSTSSDIYRGTHEFSEPETLAVRDFLRSRKKATVLVSFHTFSELILWPWGYSYDPIANVTDRTVFETMGKKMAQWNHYTAEKGSDLYLASGDTTDWAYWELKIFAYTFELSPSSMTGGGFYPGSSLIEPTFKANIEPALFLIEKAENPYAVLESNADSLRFLP